MSGASSATRATPRCPPARIHPPPLSAGKLLRRGAGAARKPGHPGRARHLAPLASLDELFDHWPSRCRCGHVFCAAERAALGEPARHQVAELPPTAVLLSEQRLQRLRCPACGATTRAELPPEVPRGAFGPRLQAAVVTLAVRNRVSPRDAVELVAELFAARICAGSVEAILQRAALALDEPYEDLLGIVRAASALNIEKSGWRSAGKRRTLQGRAQRAGGAFAAPRVATAARPRHCSARTSPASPARTAGGPFDYLDPKPGRAELLLGAEPLAVGGEVAHEVRESRAAAVPHRGSRKAHQRSTQATPENSSPSSAWAARRWRPLALRKRLLPAEHAPEACAASRRCASRSSRC